MNSLLLAGRRGILCASAVLLASTFPLNAKSSPQPEPTGSIEVRMRETACSADVYLSPVLAQVRAALDDADSLPSVKQTEDALELAYGDAVLQTDADMEYVWVKVDGVWFVYCTEGAVFQIDLGADGTVVVDVRQSEPVVLP